MRRIIITGGPSSGKTTLIEGLKKAGIIVCEEKARSVIQREVSIDSDTYLVPWRDVLGFSRAVVKEILLDSFEGHDTVYFDRGIPDVLGYLNHGDIDYKKEEFTSLVPQMEYSKTVFFLPVWEEIYGQDLERKESFEESIKISTEIKKVYEELGFQVVEVPKKNIEDRVNFILSFDV